MSFMESIKNKKKLIIIPLSIVILLIIAAFRFDVFALNSNSGKGTTDTKNLSKIVLDVQGTTCISCVEDIKAALAKVNGINEVFVDVSRGQAQVFYDDKIIKNPEIISQTITDSGYPSQITKTLTAKEIKKEEQLNRSKAEKYVAAVNGYEISRDDFLTEVNSYKQRYTQLYGEDVFDTAQGKSIESNIQNQVIQRMIDDAVILQEIEKSGFSVSKDTIEKELTLFKEDLTGKGETYNDFLLNSGYSKEFFRSKFSEYVTIKKYINDVITAGSATPGEKQRAYQVWYTNVKSLVTLTYYDKKLEQNLQTASGGGGCCP